MKTKLNKIAAILSGIFPATVFALACTDAMLTPEKYNQLSNGQSISATQNILVCAPTIESSTDVLGRKIEQHTWMGIDRSITVNFMQGFSQNKSSNNLDSVLPPVEVTIQNPAYPDYDETSSLIHIPRLATKVLGSNVLTYVYDAVLSVSPHGYWIITSSSASNSLSGGKDKYNFNNYDGTAIFDTATQLLSFPRIQSLTRGSGSVILKLEASGVWSVYSGTVISSPIDSVVIKNPEYPNYDESSGIIHIPRVGTKVSGSTDLVYIYDAVFLLNPHGYWTLNSYLNYNFVNNLPKYDFSNYDGTAIWDKTSGIISFPQVQSLTRGSGVSVLQLSSNGQWSVLDGTVIPNPTNTISLPIVDTIQKPVYPDYNETSFLIHVPRLATKAVDASVLTYVYDAILSVNPHGYWTLASYSAANLLPNGKDKYNFSNYDGTAVLDLGTHLLTFPNIQSLTHGSGAVVLKMLTNGQWSVVDGTVIPAPSSTIELPVVTNQNPANPDYDDSAHVIHIPRLATKAAGVSVLTYVYDAVLSINPNGYWVLSSYSAVNTLPDGTDKYNFSNYDGTAVLDLGTHLLTFPNIQSLTHRSGAVVLKMLTNGQWSVVDGTVIPAPSSTIELPVVTNQNPANPDYDDSAHVIHIPRLATKAAGVSVLTYVYDAVLSINPNGYWVLSSYSAVNTLPDGTDKYNFSNYNATAVLDLGAQMLTLPLLQSLTHSAETVMLKLSNNGQWSVLEGSVVPAPSNTIDLVVIDTIQKPVYPDYDALSSLIHIPRLATKSIGTDAALSYVYDAVLSLNPNGYWIISSYATTNSLPSGKDKYNFAFYDGTAVLDLNTELLNLPHLLQTSTHKSGSALLKLEASGRWSVLDGVLIPSPTNSVTLPVVTTIKNPPYPDYDDAAFLVHMPRLATRTTSASGVVDGTLTYVYDAVITLNPLGYWTLSAYSTENMLSNKIVKYDFGNYDGTAVFDTTLQTLNLPFVQSKANGIGSEVLKLEKTGHWSVLSGTIIPNPSGNMPGLPPQTKKPLLPSYSAANTLLTLPVLSVRSSSSSAPTPTTAPGATTPSISAGVGFDVTTYYDVTITLDPSGVWTLNTSKSKNEYSDGTQLYDLSGYTPAAYDEGVFMLTIPDLIADSVDIGSVVFKLSGDKKWAIIRAKGTAITIPVVPTLTLIDKQVLTGFAGISPNIVMSIGAKKIFTGSSCTVPNPLLAANIFSNVRTTYVSSMDETTPLIRGRLVDLTIGCTVNPTPVVTPPPAVTPSPTYTCVKTILTRQVPLDPLASLYTRGTDSLLTLEGWMSSCTVDVY